MQTRKERRKQLTKHLHTIISSNEQRKNQKLEELMKQLDMSHEMNEVTNEGQSILANNNEGNNYKYRFNGFSDEVLE